MRRTASAPKLSNELLPAKEELHIRPKFKKAEREVKLSKRDMEMKLENIFERFEAWASREDRIDEAIELVRTHFEPFMKGKKQAVKNISNPDQVKVKERPSKRRAKSFHENSKAKNSKN